MGLFDRIQARFVAQQEVVEVLAEAEAEGSELEIPATRYWVRHVARSQRKRGAGWTRPYRKGRTKRV
jgi:hypothetical protein